MGLGVDVLNYLLIGLDLCLKDGLLFVGGECFDMIMVVYVIVKCDKIYLVVFFCDLYVDIFGYGKNKINVVFLFGGMLLLILMLEKLILIWIDYVVVIDFEGMC